MSSEWQTFANLREHSAKRLSRRDADAALQQIQAASGAARLRTA